MHTTTLQYSEKDQDSEGKNAIGLTRLLKYTEKENAIKKKKQ
jgi:hypothetical protein